MAHTTALNDILLQIQVSLVDALQTAIPTSDITRADTVKLGLLFEDKIGKNIQIGIQSGDHDLPDELDGITTLHKLPDIGIDVPAREIGGSQIWMRRGVVRIECFFVAEKLDEEEAFEKAHLVMSRLQSALEETDLSAIERDDFGERPFGQVFCYASSFFESGGPPDSYIFRGKALWCVFTEKRK